MKVTDSLDPVRVSRRSFLGIASVALATVAVVAGTGCGGDSGLELVPDEGRTGVVYVMTNGDAAAGGNAVVAYSRAEDGTLTPLGNFATGGNGTGDGHLPDLSPRDRIDPLQSNNALYLTADGGMLFAVNAGSRTITSFRADANGRLTRVTIVPSGGGFPNSIAVSPDKTLLVVSNVSDLAADIPSNIYSFHVGRDGALTPVEDHFRSLSGETNAMGMAAQAAHVRFSPDGRLLIASEVTTNNLVVYQVNSGGTLAGPTVMDAAGVGPCGMEFFAGGSRLFVTEAQGGAATGAGQGSASTYGRNADGSLGGPVSNQIGNGQSATCGVQITPNERFAFVSNTDSGTVSSYSIGTNGNIGIVTQIAAQYGAGSGPIDMGLTPNGRFLYVLLGGQGRVAAHRVESDGRLTTLSVTTPGLPQFGTQGIVVR